MLAPAEPNIAQKLGFKVVDHEKVDDITTTILSDHLVSRRENSEFEVDGIVVMHNSIHIRSGDSNPSYGFAFKSVVTMSMAEVIVTNVEWNMSKDKYMIPVINFNEVNIGGVNIKRAHGFNGKFVKDNIIGPGSKLLIIRSGDVIPYIQKVITPSSTNLPQFPLDIEYDWNSSGVDIIAKSSSNNNSEIRLKNLVHFFDKIDVPGLSKGNITKLFEGGFTTVASIFNMSQTDYLKVDGFKQRMAEKLHQAVQEKKSGIQCVTLMAASNAFGRGFGETRIKTITDTFPDILSRDFMPSIEQLVGIKGVEKTTAEAFTINLPKYFKFKLENDLGCVYPNQQKKSNSEGKQNVGDGAKSQSPYRDDDVSKLIFENENIVFTGFRSKVLEQFIESRGGSIKATISKKTTLVIRKDDESSTKVDKALSLGITITNLSIFEAKYSVQAK